MQRKSITVGGESAAFKDVDSEDARRCIEDVSVSSRIVVSQRL